MGKHKVAGVVVKSLKVGFGSFAHIIPGLPTYGLEVGLGETSFFRVW